MGTAAASGQRLGVKKRAVAAIYLGRAAPLPSGARASFRLPARPSGRLLACSPRGAACALALLAASVPAHATNFGPKANFSDVFPRDLSDVFRNFSDDFPPDFSDDFPRKFSDVFPTKFSEVFRAGPSDALSLVPADAIVLPSAVAVFAGLPLLHLAPAHCRLCDGPDDSGLPGSAGAGRGSLNAVDAFFRDALTGAVVSRKTAGTLSTVLAYGVTPAFALGTALFATGPHASPGAGVRAAVIVVESVAVAGAATEILKVGFARKRPFVRYGTGTLESPYDVRDDETRQGFVSGHTSAVAALGVSAALCASLQDSQLAPAAWTAAGTLVAVTGTLRLVAEQHYLTDVLAGTAVGAAAGIAVPLLHRNGVRMTGNGVALSF